jgi:hypothetical protein
MTPGDLARIRHGAEWRKWWGNQPPPLTPKCRVDVIFRDESARYGYLVCDLEWAWTGVEKDIMAWRPSD